MKSKPKIKIDGEYVEMNYPSTGLCAEVETFLGVDILADWDRFNGVEGIKLLCGNIKTRKDDEAIHEMLFGADWRDKLSEPLSRFDLVPALTLFFSEMLKRRASLNGEAVPLPSAQPSEAQQKPQEGTP